MNQGVLFVEGQNALYRLGDPKAISQTKRFIHWYYEKEKAGDH